jgi:hypothetical protein
MKPHKHLTLGEIKTIMDKLAWLDTQSKPDIRVSAPPEPFQKRTAEFHNRLTTGQLL